MPHNLNGQVGPRSPLVLSPDANGGGGIGAPRQQLADEAPPKIQAFEQRLGGNRRHEEAWKRSPNTTGHGAIHVKTFHCKLNNESLDFMDQQVNEWLDAHPQY